MKILSHKIVGFSLTVGIFSLITGCASVSPATQANEPTSQTIAQAENLPSVRLLSTLKIPKINLPTNLKTKKISMDFEGTQLAIILELLGQSGNFNVLLDRYLQLDKPVTAHLIDVTVDEALTTVLSYDCLSYKVIDNNAVYIYKDPKNNECKAKPSQDKLPQSLMNGKPFTMAFEDSSLRNMFAILEQMTPTNIVLDDNVYLLPTGVYQNGVKPNIIFNRLIESNCLSYRKIGENTVFIYKPDHQQCTFTPLKESDLVKIPELQKTVTFNGEVETNYRGKPLGFWHYLFKIGRMTQTNMILKDIVDSDSETYGNTLVKANNQPAYKVLQALSKANCFDIAQLSDKSLFLFPKPTSAKCEPVKNGTILNVE